MKTLLKFRFYLENQISKSFELDEITLKDKSILEQNRLFDDLDEEDRKTVFKIVDKMLTTKKFNTFFQENLQK